MIGYMVCRKPDKPYYGWLYNDIVSAHKFDTTFDTNSYIYRISYIIYTLPHNVHYMYGMIYNGFSEYFYAKTIVVADTLQDAISYSESSLPHATCVVHTCELLSKLNLLTSQEKMELFEALL